MSVIVRGCSQYMSLTVGTRWLKKVDTVVDEDVFSGDGPDLLNG
jgi:hypothetical protein